jgi:hypothetical protein
MRITRGIVGTRKVVALLGLTSLLTTVAAGRASGQDQRQDLANALQNLFRSASPQGNESPAPPVAPPAGAAPRPGVPGREGATRGPDFVLLGVVIAGDRRLALLGDGAGGPGGSQLLHVGDTFRQHRVADVQPDRVILEGGGGERVIVRLGAGLGLGSEPSLRSDGPTAPAAAPSTVPRGAGGPRASAVRPGGREIPVQSGSAPGRQAAEEPGDRAVDQQAEKDRRQAEKDRKQAEKDARRQRR